MLEKVLVYSLTYWEREELFCVYSSIEEYLEDTFREAENTPVERIQGSIDAEQKQCASRRLQDAGEEMERVSDLGWCGMGLFEKSARRQQRAQIEFMAALGLPFLRHLRKLEPLQQLSIVNSNSMEPCFDRLMVLCKSPYSCDPFERCHWSTQDHLDSLTQPNSGWLWATDFGRKPLSLVGEGWNQASTSDTSPDLPYSLAEFQRYGLVFWDKSRLQQLRVFNFVAPQEQENEQKLQEAVSANEEDEEESEDGEEDEDYDSDDCYPIHLSRYRQPSVEERFNDARISWKALENCAPPEFTLEDEERLLSKVEY